MKIPFFCAFASVLSATTLPAAPFPSGISNFPVTFTYSCGEKPSSDCCCQKSCPLPGETAQAALKRQMTAELQRLIARYIADPGLRAKFHHDAATQPLRVLTQADFKAEKLVAPDRACLKRVSDYFDC